MIAGTKFEWVDEVRALIRDFKAAIKADASEVSYFVVDAHWLHSRILRQHQQVSEEHFRAQWRRAHPARNAFSGGNNVNLGQTKLKSDSVDFW